MRRLRERLLGVLVLAGALALIGPHAAYEVKIASVDASLPTATGGCGT